MVEIRSNRWGGAFSLTTTPNERVALLSQIAQVGVPGADERDAVHRAAQEKKVLLAANGDETQVTRETMELIAGTLAAAPSEVLDVRTAAVVAYLALAFQTSLKEHPRQ